MKLTTLIQRRHGNLLSAGALGLSLLLPLACGRADDSALLQSSADALRCGSGPCNGSRSSTATASSAAGSASTTNPGTGDASACSSDADCNDGWECEQEHGQSYCKPHGGDDDHDHSAADAGTDAGPDCEDDDECADGERCEYLGHSRHACVVEADDDDDDRSGSNSGRH